MRTAPDRSSSPSGQRRSGPGRFGSKPGGRPGGRPGSKPGGRPGARGEDGPYNRKRPFLRKKVCRFCSDKVVFVDYKEREMLRKFLTEKGKIIPRRTTGNCAKCQRKLVRAIKRARHSGLLAFQEA